MPASSKTVVVGVTGSIATGKSTVVGWLKKLGYAVFEADAAVHHMFQHNPEVIKQVQELWPDCVSEQGVDRACLRGKIYQDRQNLKKLEAITHPVVQAMSLDFLGQHKEALVFLDIPLLFEGSADYNTDAVLVVTCSRETQRARALARGTDPKIFDYLLSQQIPAQEKETRADFVLDTDETLAQTRERLVNILDQIKQRFGIATCEKSY